MAPYETGDTPADGPQWPGAAERTDSTGPRTGRKATRYVVPLAVVGVAAATIGLVPALADSGDPDLPKITAEQLIAKMATSDTEQLSGTVKINTDLGLPDFGGMAGFALGQRGPANSADSTADPQSQLLRLASGAHTLRVAVDGPTRHKLSVLGDASEYSVIHNGDELWAYDSATDQAYHATAKATGRGTGKDGTQGMPKPRHDTGKLPGDDVPATPDELARQTLAAVDDTTSVTVDGTEHVAGRDAYKLLVKPKQAGSTTVGAISLAVDAERGVPLKFTLTPAGGGNAVVDVGYTQVDFGKPSADTFHFTPPKGTKVTEADELAQERRNAHRPDDLGMPGGGLFAPNGAKDMKVIGKSWDSIAEFTLPGGQGLPNGAAGSSDVPLDAQKFLDSLGGTAHGTFGSGTVFSTRLINALVTDDGKVYVGAVTKDALVKAANEAQ